MGNEESGGATPPQASAKGRRWTTGDLDRDWTRYEGLFDRLDARMQKGLLGLLGLNAVLVIPLSVLAVSGGPDRPLELALKTLLPLPGFVVSLAIYWSLFRINTYRSELASRWIEAHPAVRPVPIGHRNAFIPSNAWAPQPLIAMLTACFWLAVIFVRLWDYFGPANSTERLLSWGLLIATLCAIAVLYAVAVSYVNNRSLDPADECSSDGESTHAEIAAQDD
ncbi:MAG: hypothetical protein KF886_15140 [Candidatus Hydrogenedentes bacterium]|nr:hypothetical protein [Candidatus Hydrogenedentota bacterium]